MADPSTCLPLVRASVEAAHELIRPYIHRTPVLTNATLNTVASTPQDPSALAETEWAGRTPSKPVLRLWFKCENMQRIGAFKARGAFHALERLMQDPTFSKEHGVVTQSSGNHSQALALAAREKGIAAHIVMPSISPPPKIAATKGYGANVVFSGSTIEDREAVAARVMAETGARMVPPYNHPDIILGQGTMGLELQEQVAELMAGAQEKSFGGSEFVRASVTQGRLGPKGEKQGLDAMMAPCSGGGMLSGVALSAEGTGIKVFGAEPSFEGADDATRGYYAGKRIEKVSSLTIADGLRSVLGTIPWSIIYERRLVAGMYSVTEDQIKAALRLVYERMKMVVEPSAVVGLAVALYNEDFRSMVEKEAGEDGWDLGIVLSGGNISLESLGKLFAD
ncbi:serine racemase [Thozetella sp. PMI_491]|nr:serine racemase [Thozetella sp. PMI_491]